MIWLTTPDLWVQLSSSAHHMGDNPSCLLHLFKYFPGQAQDLFFTGEHLVKSLTNNLDLSLANQNLKVPHDDNAPAPIITVEQPIHTPLLLPTLQVHAPERAPWLLGAILLMGLNFYFLQLSPLNNKDTFHLALLTLLEIKQGQCTIQGYIEYFLKLKKHTQLEDKMVTILFQKGVNPTLRDLLKHHPPTLSLEELLLLCK
ncbi:hypothetical protein DSO57_1017609 [Entomophthora muscae]|uniref:Uncharacterized protein n=1 Tax=Entomophthora muscae TaxID=34485 RepID=A0ACC2S6N1_9FUNG|nr:hypothetical protein DSO57_1017609 [Entomophthora muscae]